MRTNNTQVAKNVQTNNNAVVQQALTAPVSAPVQQPASVPAQAVQYSAPVVQQPTAPSTLRAKRIAAVQVGLHARYRAAKVAKHQNATATHAQNAILAQVQALYAQAGLPVPNTLSVRAVPGLQNNPASAVQGACALVRAYVHANPHATRKMVMQHFTGTNYVNPATVSTQYQRAKNGAK